MKNRSINMLIVAFLLLGVMAIMLITFLGKAKEDFAENITVTENGTTESTLSVRELKLTPTESKEYSVNLLCAASGSYSITLDYIEKEDGGMKSFVDVVVKADDVVVYEGKLDSLLDDDVIVGFDGNLEAKVPFVVSISYSMSRDVGNEAQRTYSDFDIQLCIEKN